MVKTIVPEGNVRATRTHRLKTIQFQLEKISSELAGVCGKAEDFIFGLGDDVKRRKRNYMAHIGV